MSSFKRLPRGLVCTSIFAQAARTREDVLHQTLPDLAQFWQGWAALHAGWLFQEGGCVLRRIAGLNEAKLCPNCLHVFTILATQSLHLSLATGSLRTHQPGQTPAALDQLQPPQRLDGRRGRGVAEDRLEGHGVRPRSALQRVRKFSGEPEMIKRVPQTLLEVGSECLRVCEITSVVVQSWKPETFGLTASR